jgi:penicillin-binding protein 1A
LPNLAQIASQIIAPTPREPPPIPMPQQQPLPPPSPQYAPQQTIGSTRPQLQPPSLPPTRAASSRPEPSAGLGLDGWLVDRLFGR